MTRPSDPPLRGVYPILPTPFRDDGALDADALARLIDFQIDVGAHGAAVLVLGEAHKLAAEERRSVVDAVVARAAGRRRPDRGRVRAPSPASASRSTLACDVSHVSDASPRLLEGNRP